jgi:hypothetical protein
MSEKKNLVNNRQLAREENSKQLSVTAVIIEIFNIKKRQYKVEL